MVFGVKMSLIKDIRVQELATWVASMYLGSMVVDYFHNWMDRQLEFKGNLTFSGAVRYANSMEE